MTTLQPGLARFYLFVTFVLFAPIAMPSPAHAITINIEYTTDTGGEENPDWDESGAILIAHFQAAKAIWEALLPGGGEYTFDFQWDNDIPGLGLYTPGPDQYIEIHPDSVWFADPDPLDDVEFGVGVQKRFSGLTASEQLTFFPGTVPPSSLEVSYRANGMSDGTFVGGVPINTLSASGQLLPGTATPVDSSNGFDLLSVVLHEIGHALGISGTEPGEYNIFPQHVGGLTNVLVLEHPDSGHLGGNATTPGFLMNPGTPPGQRVFATATDVLVIAEDQGITVVQLARVGSIANGLWSNANNWLGGDVPDSTQDVYITHGGTVTVDGGAGAKNVLVAPGNGIAIQAGQSLFTPGTLTFTGGTLSVGAGAWVAANTFVGNPGAMTTAAGSTVRFNQFTEVSPTAANFGGSLAIGFDLDPGPLFSPPSATFNPSSANWNIAENLIVGDQIDANLIVDNGVWDVNGNATLGKVLTALNGGWYGGMALQNNGEMTIDGNLDIPLGSVTVEDTATLNVTGNITIGKQSGITYRDNRTAASRPHSLAGGFAVPIEGSLIQIAGGYLTFEDSATAADATVTLDGGSGQGAAGGAAYFRDNSMAGTADFTTKSGHFGPSPPSLLMMGNGGFVHFEDSASADRATIVNQGLQESVPGNFQIGGSGGRTFFIGSSTAGDATIHNHGPTTNFGYFGTTPGGATHFFDNSSAGTSDITNHGDGVGGIPQGASTVFFGFSSADRATIENAAGQTSTTFPGRTEFRNESTAGNATIHIRGPMVAAGGAAAGRTFFYDQSTAAAASIEIYEGAGDAGRLEFYNNSKAGNAHIIVNSVPSIFTGGHVLFHNNSSAEDARITLRADTCCTGVQFYNSATAARALIITETNSGGVTFWGTSTAADATIQLGRGSVNTFWDSSTAANAIYSLAGGAQVQFNMNSSAGSATIVADGSTVYPVAGGRVLFNSTSLINNSAIVAHGGTASLAAGATVEFINGAHAGNATITANGPSNGGTGAQITFDSGAKGDNAQLIANAGASVDFMSQRLYGDGSTTVGSIEGAGTVLLRGSHLITGSRNTDTTVSGPIIDHPTGFVTGGRLTKVGTGTLTLAGTNTYSGLTTVNAGALNVTGSIAGGTVVKTSGTLGGTGNVGGPATVESGAHLAPGTSIGTITMAGGLTTNAGSILDFELGTPNTGDKVNVTLAGGLTLNGGTVNLFNAGGLGAGTYTLIDYAGTLGGALGNLTLGAQPAGFSYSLVNNAVSTAIELMVSPGGVPGDYNNNGTVDAADYVLWRKGGPLANEVNNPGTVNAQDYTEWRSRFGNSSGGAGSGSSDSASASPAVPEPSSIVLLLVSSLVGAVCRKHRAKGLMPCRS